MLARNFRNASIAVPIIFAVVSASAIAEELTGVLKKVKESGEITLGHRDASVPFSYLDDKQQPVGYSMDLCLRVADAVKNELKLPALKIKYNPVTSATRIPLVANGTVDIECGSTVNNRSEEHTSELQSPMY